MSDEESKGKKKNDDDVASRELEKSNEKIEAPKENPEKPVDDKEVAPGKTAHNNKAIPEKPVRYKEVIRLIQYVVERGLDPEGKIIRPLYKAVESYNKTDDEKTFDEKVKATEDTLILYGKLNELTYAGVNGSNAINGRTLLDTELHYKNYAYKVLSWGLFFLFLAVGSKSLDLWATEIAKALPENPGFLYYFHIYFLKDFSPFWWGGLGACVFLMKRLSDKAAERCFDSQRWKGGGTRIMLGALLGLIVAHIYNTGDDSGVEGLKLGPSAIAFFTGVSVRVFYGIIEKTIDAIAEKFNLGSSNKKQNPSGQPSGSS